MMQTTAGSYGLIRGRSAFGQQRYAECILRCQMRCADRLYKHGRSHRAPTARPRYRYERVLEKSRGRSAAPCLAAILDPVACRNSQAPGLHWGVPDPPDRCFLLRSAGSTVLSAEYQNVLSLPTPGRQSDLLLVRRDHLAY